MKQLMKKLAVASLLLASAAAAQAQLPNLGGNDLIGGLTSLGGQFLGGDVVGQLPLLGALLSEDLSQLPVLGGVLGGDLLGDGLLPLDQLPSLAIVPVMPALPGL